MTALAITIAQALDLMTASPARELNPLAAALMASGFAFPAKTALCALVLAYVALYRERRPRLAQLVVAVAVVAGTVGAWSNL